MKMRATWTLLSQNAQVTGLDDGPAHAGHRPRRGCATASVRRAATKDYVREALVQVLGVDWKVEAIVDPSTPSRPAAAGDPERAVRPAAAEAAVAAGRAEPGAAEAEVAPRRRRRRRRRRPTHQDLLARELGAKVIGSTTQLTPVAPPGGDHEAAARASGGGDHRPRTSRRPEATPARPVRRRR